MARFSVVVCAAASFGIASAALAQGAGRAVRVVTNSRGTFLVADEGPLARRRPAGSPDSVLWTFNDPIAIPESGAIGGAGSVWIGEALNNERLQRFALTGNGTPLNEFPGTHALFNPAAAAAARGGDLAAFLDQRAQGGQLVLTAYNSASTTSLWTFAFPTTYNSSDVHNVKVSRNGSVVACVANDTVNNACIAYFFNSATGIERARWTSMDGTCTGIDLTDDGSQALVCHVTTARLIDTMTGLETYSAIGSGAGGRYNISGDGNVLVVGGFSLQVYRKVGGVYQTTINFSAPTSWFSWASAVSRDGSTVGVLAHDYASNYLNTATRVWDVASGQLLGTYLTFGSGLYQDSAWGAAMSDNGQRLVACSWGDQGNSHPAVMVFDRQAHLVGSLTTPGSPWAVDVTPDGSKYLATNKSVHANVFGNGGAVTVFDVLGAACYANCDNSTIAPILNVGDFVCFQAKFAAGDSGANCDGSTVSPVLNVSDFVCFQSRFAAGCP